MGQNLQLHIEGMTCTSCAAAVEKALSNVPQVKVAQVNFAGHKALLELDNGADNASTADSDQLQQTLRKAVHDAGYSVVDPAERRAEADKHLRRERNRLIWSWVVTLPLAVQMLLHMVWDIHILPMNVAPWVTVILSGVVIFGIGWPVIRSTINSFRKMAFTMDSLIGIGAAAAFSTGILRLAGVTIDDFTAIGAMIIAINFIGNYIKVKATGRASSAIQQLLEMGAKQATRLTSEGSEELIDVAHLEVGDVVRVRPGEKVPSDGTITRGSTSIDESIVSGESVPVDKEAGSAVVGATINQMGTIEVRVERTGEDTFLSQIVELVEEAQSSRVPVQELADRVTAIFVPAILVLSLLTFGGWMALTAAGIVGTVGLNVSAALSAAIATLVIACPCALGLATPTALMVGMGYGAERGILVRNGEAIQTARSLDTVVFDKTGTLTVGRPEVRRSEHYTPGPADTNSGGQAASGAPAADLPDPRLLTLTVEQQSEHPLARAIRSHLEAETADGGAGSGAAEPSGSTLEIDNVEAVPGHGIRSTISNHPVLVGSIRWLTEEGIALEEAQRATAEEWKRDGMTVVGTAADGRLVGMYGLADAIKDDAQGAIAALHRLGLRTAMLTGDNDTAARAIAGRAGIDDVFAELLPAQKIDAVKKLQGEGRTVAMVGDGINDAPALKQANVGVAIGTGTDIAIESADITLMSSSLAMIPRAVEISRSTFGKIKTNLFWAFIYNVVAIPLAVMGLLHPVVAEIAMAFSSITVVSNSLHLKRILKKEERRHDMGLFGTSNKVEYTVPDMSCGHCEAKVTSALQGVDGIKKVKATAKDKRVVIEYTGESAPDLATVNEVLEPAGYPAQA